MAKIKTIQEMLEEKAAGLKIRPAVEIPKEALKKKKQHRNSLYKLPSQKRLPWSTRSCSSVSC